MSCRKQQESYWTIELRVLVPQVLTLTANSLGGTDSRNHDNTSMFPVNMNCVLSVNASVARAASVGYCLKMVQIEPRLAISLSLVLYRDCLGLHNLNSKITGMPCHSLSATKHSSDRGA